MTNPLAQDLGGVVRLLERDPLDPRNIDKAVQFLLAHPADIAGALRDAERWQPIESAPMDGRAVILAHMGGKPYIGKWCHDTWVDERGLSRGPSHWRPLPAPPTQDSAMQQGGGGGEAAA